MLTPGCEISRSSKDFERRRKAKKVINMDYERLWKDLRDEMLQLKLEGVEQLHPVVVLSIMSYMTMMMAMEI